MQNEPIGSQETTVLYVGNIPFSWDDTRLREFCGQQRPRSSQVVRDRYSGRSRGYGLLTFSDRETARQAASTLNGQTVDGHTIIVTVARIPHIPV